MSFADIDFPLFRPDDAAMSQGRSDFKNKCLSFAAGRMLVFGACLSALFGVAVSTATTKDSTPSAPITIRVYNYSFAERADVMEMQKEATRIFVASGVETRWIQCSPMLAEDPALAECRSSPDHTTTLLLLLSDVSSANREVLGYTIRGTSAIQVGYNSGRRTHEDFPYVSCGRILGHVAAHEIGHVLLGPKAHSVSGIMRPTFRNCDLSEMAQGALLFLPEQSRLLRSRILSLSPAPEILQTREEARSLLRGFTPNFP